MTGRMACSSAPPSQGKRATTLEGIERYLGSGMIRGIGAVYATLARNLLYTGVTMASTWSGSARRSPSRSETRARDTAGRSYGSAHDQPGPRRVNRSRPGCSARPRSASRLICPELHFDSGKPPSRLVRLVCVRGRSASPVTNVVWHIRAPPSGSQTADPSEHDTGRESSGRPS
jgi:hypothetical protein